MPIIPFLQKLKKSKVHRPYLCESPESIVDNALEGFAKVHNHVVLHRNEKIIRRRNIPLEQPIALISGGGSGHEPGFAGYVGKNLLDAAVSGNVFASPSTGQIYKAITSCCYDFINKKVLRKCILIVLNYTGDCLNFKLAKEKAACLGIECGIVLVEDDAALKKLDKQDDANDKADEARPLVGPRGLAGVIFVAKILGAFIQQQNTNQEIDWKNESTAKNFFNSALRLGHLVSLHVSTIGISLSGCSRPGQEVGCEGLKYGKEIEIGLGIHGEPGRYRKAYDNGSFVTIIQGMLDLVLKVLPNKKSSTLEKQDIVSKDTTSAVKKKTELIVLINNLGASTNLEIYCVAQAIQSYFEKSSEYKVLSYMCGTFLSSLDMHGISLTIFDLDSCEHSLEASLSTLSLATTTPFPGKLMGYLLAPTNAPVFPTISLNSESKGKIVQEENNVEKSKAVTKNSLSFRSIKPQWFRKAVINGSLSLIEKKESLNVLDKFVGDGDTGDTLAAGCMAFLHEVIWASEGQEQVNQELVLKTIEKLLRKEDIDSSTDHEDTEKASSGNFTSFNHSSSFFVALGDLIAESTGGSLGPLLGAFCYAISSGIFAKEKSIQEMTACDWGELIDKGAQSI
eukprot:g3560.t1